MAKVELPFEVVSALDWMESSPGIYRKPKDKRRELMLVEITNMYKGFGNAHSENYAIADYVGEDATRFAEVVHALSVGWVKQTTVEDKLGDLIAETRLDHSMAPTRSWSSRSKLYYEGKYAGIREAAKVAGIEIN